MLQIIPPLSITDATHTTHSRHTEGYPRVEYTPVPIILLIFRKMMVTGPTEYPRGEEVSTGAPDASW